MKKETLKWKMIVDLTIENDDDESITDGTIYMDEEFGYYQRTLWVCGSSYSSTFRFGKDRMGDVLKYIVDNSPIDLEEYLSTLDEYEWIESDHNL